MHSSKLSCFIAAQGGQLLLFLHCPAAFKSPFASSMACSSTDDTVCSQEHSSESSVVLSPRHAVLFYCRLGKRGQFPCLLHSSDELFCLHLLLCDCNVYLPSSGRVTKTSHLCWNVFCQIGAWSRHCKCWVAPAMWQSAFQGHWKAEAISAHHSWS